MLCKLITIVIMKTFKLDFDDFIDEDFDLLAIHSTLESYRLAYYINSVLELQLKKSERIQDFDFYEYNDEKNQRLWSLVANKATIENTDAELRQNSLFSSASKSYIYLLPELKKVDFFLKIETNFSETQNLISKIKDIPQIITTFAVDVNTLKSKNNLIFH